MNTPVLNNFSPQPSGPRSGWRRYAWAIALGVIILAGAGWYISGKLSVENEEPLTAPAASGTIAPVSTPASAPTPRPVATSGVVYDYTEAPQHIGENAKVRGQVLSIFTSSKGTIFLDFCNNSKNCPFSVVIFPANASKFPTKQSLQGKTVIISGILRSYQGQAEIAVENPDQIIIQS